MKNIISKISNLAFVSLALGLMFLTTGCDFDFQLPEENSQVDLELPVAGFAETQNPLSFKDYQFQNQSEESLFFEWDFGTGDSSTEENPMYTFEAGEGTYTVSLTASDANGESDTFTKDVVVVEPELPDVLDVVLINGDFDKIPKSSGSDCSCSGWINKDIGEQGESSSGNGGTDNVVKFDNNEPDHIYQEFEVVPNEDYTVTIATSFKPLEGGSFPGSLEVRVLAGSGYVDGYVPVYYEEAVDFPQEGWGYQTVDQVEDPENNLLIEVQDNPDTEDYLIYEYVFNSGANTSLALFVRGIGGDAIGDYLYTGGDEEIRADFVTITANN